MCPTQSHLALPTALPPPPPARGAGEKHERAIAKLKEGWGAELRRQREGWAAAERVKREQWMGAKTQEVKDITVKGLESEVGRRRQREGEACSTLTGLLVCKSCQ